jgi:hypothetical protein
MSRAIALAQPLAIATARSMIVLGCGAALILAGRVLPF